MGRRGNSAAAPLGRRPPTGVRLSRTERAGGEDSDQQRGADEEARRAGGTGRGGIRGGRSGQHSHRSRDAEAGQGPGRGGRWRHHLRDRHRRAARGDAVRACRRAGGRRLRFRVTPLLRGTSRARHHRAHDGERQHDRQHRRRHGPPPERIPDPHHDRIVATAARNRRRGAADQRSRPWPYGHGYHGAMTEIAAGKFKNACLRLLDDVARTRTPIVITRRGRPIAELAPIPRPGPRPTLNGSVLGESGSPYETGEAWDADRPWTRMPGSGG